jgi:hypothetical protein
MKTEDIIGYCSICKKPIIREPIDKWHFYKGLFVCRHHKGVEEWYAQIWNKTWGINKNVPTDNDQV